jgi:hypothetical protein
MCGVFKIVNYKRDPRKTTTTNNCKTATSTIIASANSFLHFSKYFFIASSAITQLWYKRLRQDLFYFICSIAFVKIFFRKFLCVFEIRHYCFSFNHLTDLILCFFNRFKIFFVFFHYNI